jgi:hypothetical protein
MLACSRVAILFAAALLAWGCADHSVPNAAFAFVGLCPAYSLEDVSGPLLGSLRVPVGTGRLEAGVAELFWRNGLWKKF